MPLEIIEFRADTFQLSKCNARIHTEFCVGEGEGEIMWEVVRIVD